MPRESGSEPSASGSGEGSCTFVLKLVFSLPCWWIHKQKPNYFLPGNITCFVVVLRVLGFPVLRQTRHGLENTPSLWLQSRLTASSVGQIVGLCSAEIKQIVSEYAEKVCGGSAGVFASGNAPKICPFSLHPPLAVMEAGCNSSATLVKKHMSHKAISICPLTKLIFFSVPIFL